MSVPSFLSVSMSANMFLIVLFVPGARTQCPERSGLFITSPQRMEALNGSCLLIPCNFSARYEYQFVSTRETFGLWNKENQITYNPRNVVYNSRWTVLKYPISITGDLKEKNCTTLFSNVNATFKGIYYFRIMNWPFRSTAICDPLNITVRDSPWSPRIEISGDLKEEESVTITCSALTPCPHSPPKLTWSLQSDSLNNMEENTDGTFTTQIQESITLSEHHDGYNITCSATYPVNEGRDVRTAEETKTLSVSYSPRNTSVLISPSDPVSAGSTVNLTCSCRGNPPVVHFVWYRISDGRLELIKVDSQVYVLKVTSSDRGRSFLCGCRNDRDIQLSTGLQLIFEGDHSSEPVGLEVVLKILGILLLVSTLIIFEWWFRSRRSMKPVKEAEEADYVNTAAEFPSSQQGVLTSQAASGRPI
ncbi:sialic acid-binding Ig-like lectin 7 [Notolabrus celidotus]|uniref:sialic acid-binding Ig-like lectin 7 n=1 Tax=Notolabrus celidotus TaxID=1203425 RepID=UPI00148FB6A4|nr:sialic acid-binding Ig-like lectin 7 [Notolabrus celidotus]